MELPPNKKFILFDDVCKFCNSYINLLIRIDSKDQFRFIALNSNLGVALCNELKINCDHLDSIILYDPKSGFFVKSKAIFEIIKNLGGMYQLLLLFRIMPITITDFLYDVFAKNRYLLFGKKQECPLPDLKVRDKFL